jgi:membrane protease YdiL (CAAX protease family)
MASATILDHLLASLIGLVLPAVRAVQLARSYPLKEVVELEPSEKIAVYWANSALLAVLGAGGLFVWWFADRTWQELGMTSPPGRLGWGLLLTLVFVLSYAVDTWRELSPERLPETRARWRRDTPFMPGTAREVRHSLVLVAAAALFEEILYRGFLIAYVAYFTGSTPVGLAAAVALPALVFGVSHSYQGLQAVFKIVVMAGMFGAIFVVTRSLWIPIALHAMVDLVGMLLGPRLMARTGIDRD